MGKSKKGKRKSKGSAGQKKATPDKKKAAAAEKPAKAVESDESDESDESEDTADEPESDDAPEAADASDDTGDNLGDEPPPPPLVKLIRTLDEALGKIELAAVSFFVLAMVGVAVYQFVQVTLLHGKADWADEVLRYSVFFTAMSAAALAAQQQRMMAVDILPRLLTPKTRAATRIFIAVFVVFICYLLYTAGMLNRASEAQKTEHYHLISAPTGILALPIGALFIGIHFLFQAIMDFTYLVSGRTPPEPEMAVH